MLRCPLRARLESSVCRAGGGGEYLVVALHVLQRGDHGEAVVRRGQTGVLLALTQQVVDERGLACPPRKPNNQLLQACIRSRSHHTGGVVAHHQHHGHGGALARHHVAEVIQRLQHRVVQLRMNPRHPLGHQHSPTPAQRPRDGRTLSTSWVTWRSTVLGSTVRVCVHKHRTSIAILRGCSGRRGEKQRTNHGGLVGQETARHGARRHRPRPHPTCGTGVSPGAKLRNDWNVGRTYGAKRWHPRVQRPTCFPWAYAHTTQQ